MSNTAEVSQAALLYLQEVDLYRKRCARHINHAAVHDCGNSLQIYRIFKSSSQIADHLRKVCGCLSEWDCTKQLCKLERDVVARMNKHSKQRSVLTKGVQYDFRPILIHAYKFEPDPILKVELIIPSVDLPITEYPLRTIARALRLHEDLVPECIANPEPPYSFHETKFLTLNEYLSQSMPSGLYASPCFPFHRNDSG